MMQKIIYIAGLGHSGSTILDMSLGALPGIVGLGELKTLLDDNTRSNHMASTCSCGKRGYDCPVWSDLNALLEEKGTLEEKYERVVQAMENKFSSQTTLVDSSKNSYSYLSYLASHYDLKVIYITRDVRSWSHARAISTGKPFLYFVIRWFLEGKKLQWQLKRMKITCLKVGYEELALYPEYILPLISGFTGIGYTADALTPYRTKSHIISGNIARVDKEKKTRWMYDARWMRSRRIMLWGPILLLLSRSNRNLVYSNLKNKGTGDFTVFGSGKRSRLAEKHN